MNPKVDWFFNKTGQWQDEYSQLRKVALASGLTEELKWGCPCYTLNGANVVLIHGFKNYCAYLFHKGALLSDPKKILIQQTANVQSARQIRFTHLDQITDMEATLNAYLKAAIKVEKSGAKVELKKTTEFEMPDEFKAALKKSAALQKAFKLLTPGRQRGYLLYFASAKQTKTREERIKKYTSAILKGKGLED